MTYNRSVQQQNTQEFIFMYIYAYVVDCIAIIHNI